jgi:hypothetical protein
MNVAGSRVVACLLVGAVGALAGATFARFAPSGIDSQAIESSPRRTQIQMPAPRLTPDEVVRLQVGALRAFGDDASAINQCYVLASPANRAYTGPLNRFIAMVRSPTFGTLVSQTSTLVGQPVIRGGQATVLVTVLDPSRTPHVFRFFLSKQTDRHYLDCWMTDAVIPVHGPTQPGSGHPPSTASAA